MSQLLSERGLGERLNFLLTNRIPRIYATRFMGWYSRIENPVLTRISIAIWRLFAEDLRLEESRQRSFNSLHECFTRQLVEGARHFDQREDVVCSPCDAELGAMGRIEGARVYQAKGFPYELQDLIPDQAVRERLQDGWFVTLRLKSSMYHRFHAPMDCELKRVRYISGDTWNVNPIALRRVHKLFCKNERVVLDLYRNDEPAGLCLVPVAAILVASIKMHCLPHDLDLRYDGARHIDCDASYGKGQEMGYFQHGSTIIVFADSRYEPMAHLTASERINAGEPLFRMPAANSVATGHSHPVNNGHKG